MRGTPDCLQEFTAVELAHGKRSTRGDSQIKSGTTWAIA